jgi:NitT/TauT family transport system ATP-binding protein
MQLEVEHLNFAYEKQPLLTDLSFGIAKREFVSVLGPSGCGKSTLLNILAGILTQDSGEIRFEGRALAGIGGPFAYMPQNDLLFPWLTILDNAALYGTVHGQKAEARETARGYFEAFGLAGCEDKFPRELSGGMRQRAAFLRTTLCEAEILLLDEPFGALDVITRNEMQDWLAAMRRKLDRTILLVTHDTDEAIYLSDRIIVLGRPGEGIRDIIAVDCEERTRDWLYDQKTLRRRIHNTIEGEIHGEG